mmetsp:Transcript_11198/g.20273  ORF Transcript_11198/g.20273 Transcript_11198/m.20273 type:complete len:251 (-) Transcript_11198:397-1149(-)
MPTTIVTLIETSLQSLLKGEIPPTEIIAELLSLVLGNCVLLGACVTKLPLIFNIYRSRSAAGLNLPSLLFELIALLISSTYGFMKGLKFSSYGDSVILTLQCLVTISLVHRFGKVPLYPLLLVAVGIYAYAVFNGYLTLTAVLPLLGVKNIIVLGALVPQIIQNFRNKSTGPLSSVTYLLNTVGCMVRVFTSFQERDYNLIRDYMLSLILNFTLLLQIIIYGYRHSVKTVEVKARGGEEKEVEKEAKKTK